jgi:hypothetical protein
MMALEDTDIRPDARMLPRLIEHAESIGDWSRFEQLREWLAEAQTPRASSPRKLPAQDDLTEENYQNAEPDETIVTVSLPFRPEIRNRFYDRGEADICGLTRWRPWMLYEVLGRPQYVWEVDQLCTAVGFPIGSAVELLSDLPPRSPFGLDLRDGRRPEDVTDVLRRMAYGELTFRDASVVLGSRGLSKVRPHQRACSVVIRHARMYANFRRMAIMDQHHGESWLIEAVLREFAGAKPGWGLQIHVAGSQAQVAERLEAVVKPVYGGLSSRGCPIVLVWR